jgi:hypothetical protein
VASPRVRAEHKEHNVRNRRIYCETSAFVAVLSYWTAVLSGSTRYNFAIHAHVSGRGDPVIARFGCPSFLSARDFDSISIKLMPDLFIFYQLVD